MKTTLDISDSILWRAKAKAREHGVSLSQFVSEAVAEKLRATGRKEARTRLAGGLRHLRKETARINQRIEQEFEIVRHG